MDTMQKSVVRAIDRMTRAFQQADIDGVMRVYEPGAVVAFEPGDAVHDRDRMQEIFAQWFALSPRFEYAGHDVLVAGDLALHLAPWTMRGIAPDGSAIERQGLSVAVLRRQADGEWRIVIDNPHGQHLMRLEVEHHA
jgi:uncharacterized protein (TIGR02246 family)